MSLIVDNEGAVSITVNPVQMTLAVVDNGPTVLVNQAVTQLVAVAEQGPAGAPGGSSTYTFTFPTPSTVWNVAHYLGRFPVPMFVDTASEVITTTFSYPDSNTIIATFSEPTSGVAYLT